MKSESYKKREGELRLRYSKFLKTEEGKQWEKTRQNANSDGTCDFGDFLYDFYTEMLM